MNTSPYFDGLDNVSDEFKHEQHYLSNSSNIFHGSHNMPLQMDNSTNRAFASLNTNLDGTLFSASLSSATSGPSSAMSHGSPSYDHNSPYASASNISPHMNGLRSLHLDRPLSAPISPNRMFGNDDLLMSPDTQKSMLLPSPPASTPTTPRNNRNKQMSAAEKASQLLSSPAVSSMYDHIQHQYNGNLKYAPTEVRRQLHIQCEQKRRRVIKDGFDEMRQEIPGCGTKKMSKAQILTKSLEFVRQVKQEKAWMEQECERLRAELHNVKQYYESKRM